MVRPRVVLSESKIRTRKTPICLSPEPLAICVQIFDLLSDRKGGGNPPPFPSYSLATLRLPRSVTGGTGT